MKKTLITAILACAAAASAADITLTSPGQTDDKRAGYTGFDFTLNNTAWLTPTPAGSTLTEEVTLNSMTIKSYATWFRNKPMGIAIYQKVGSTWNFVGKSAWETSVPVGTNEFEFSSLDLSSATTYTAVFYGVESAFSSLAAGSTLTSLAGLEVPTAETPIAVAGLSLATAVAGSETIYGGTPGTAATDYMPVVSFTVTNTPAIPEPTTATLSLLALAGLAARRRRK